MFYGRFAICFQSAESAPKSDGSPADENGNSLADDIDVDDDMDSEADDEQIDVTDTSQDAENLPVSHGGFCQINPLDMSKSQSHSTITAH